MTTTIRPQATAATTNPAGPLTVPLEIIRAAGARHRIAVEHHEALPSWALAATSVLAAALIVFGVAEWRDVASPLLIACAMTGAVAAFLPDVLAARHTHDTKDAA